MPHLLGVCQLVKCWRLQQHVAQLEPKAAARDPTYILCKYTEYFRLTHYYQHNNELGHYRVDSYWRCASPPINKHMQLLGKELVLWRDGQGRWTCFDDRCPHRAAPLTEGRVEKDGSLM